MTNSGLVTLGSAWKVRQESLASTWSLIQRSVYLLLALFQLWWPGPIEATPLSTGSFETIQPVGLTSGSGSSAGFSYTIPLSLPTDFVKVTYSYQPTGSGLFAPLIGPDGVPTGPLSVRVTDSIVIDGNTHTFSPSGGTQTLPPGLYLSLSLRQPAPYSFSLSSPAMNVLNGTFSFNVTTNSPAWSLGGTSVDLAISTYNTTFLRTLAHLSSNVYAGNSGFDGFTFLTSNCILLPDTCSNAGFRATAYQNAATNQIVVAFKGTAPTDDTVLKFVKTLLADTSFATGIPGPNLKADVADAAAFLAKIRDTNAGANITLTGHSLGGAIAQLVGQASGLAAYVFNAPGAAKLSAQLGTELSAAVPAGGATSSGVSENYRMYGDVVSRIGVPLPGSATYTLASDIVPRSLIDQYPMGFALHNHSIDTVISQVEINAPLSAGATGPGFPHVIYPVSLLTRGLFLFVFDIDAAIRYTFDPDAGSRFRLIEDSGSPYFHSVGLPLVDGVSSYAVRYLVGDAWSAFQVVAPGMDTVWGAGVSGFEFDAFDPNGRGVDLPDGFLFDLTFASSGTFSGELTISQQQVSLPFSLWLFVVGLTVASIVRWRSQ